MTGFPHKEASGSSESSRSSKANSRDDSSKHGDSPTVPNKPPVFSPAFPGTTAGGSHASLAGVGGAGVAAGPDRTISGSAGHHPPTHLVGQFHGIRTPEEVYSWPEFGTDWWAMSYPHVRTYNSDYYESFLPRLAALRNLRRSAVLSSLMLAAVQAQHPARPAEASVICHSNGGVLGLQTTRRLIEAGVPVRTLVLIAPALRTKAATREIATWIERGMLGSAVLVQPEEDGVIGLISLSWKTKLLAWPWGALGVDGWSEAVLDEHHLARESMFTIFLPKMGHSEPVEAGNRLWLYEELIAPALGFLPWSSLVPSTSEVTAA